MGMAKFFEGNMAKDFGVEWKKFGSGVTNWVWVRNNFFRVQVANLFWTKNPQKIGGQGALVIFATHPQNILSPHLHNILVTQPPKYFALPPQ